MTHEIDLPCSDCGTALVERTVHVHDLPGDAQQGDALVAACPTCGGRYYPDATLTQLFDSTNDPPHGGTRTR